jgi:hypothetical protein
VYKYLQSPTFFSAHISVQGTDNMAPEKKSSDINIDNIPHTGKLDGVYQELPPTEDAPSVQEFQGLDTSELQQVAPAPETSGTLTLGDSERPAFQDKLTAQREYHEQKSATTTESHTGRNITVGLAALALAGGAIAGVTALNNHSPEAAPSASATNNEGVVGELPTATATASAERTLPAKTEATSATNTGLEGYTKSITVTLPERVGAGVSDAEIAEVANKLKIEPVYTTDPNLLTTEKGVLEAFDLMQPQLQNFLNAAHANRHNGPEENAVVHAYRSKLEGLNIDKQAAPLALNELAKEFTDPSIMENAFIYLPKSESHGDFNYTTIDDFKVITGYDGQKVATGTLSTAPLIVDKLPEANKIVTIKEAKQTHQVNIPVQFRLVPAANGKFEIRIV